MTLEQQIAKAVYKKLWLSEDVHQTPEESAVFADNIAVAVGRSVRQGSPEIRWCKEHNQATYEDDDPLFCAYGEARWESMCCEVVPALVLLGAGSQGSNE